jgi:hypothetical protein
MGRRSLRHPFDFAIAGDALVQKHRHSREGGNPWPTSLETRHQALDSRLRGNDGLAVRSNDSPGVSRE